MKRSTSPSDAPPLFDLPLGPEKEKAPRDKAAGGIAVAAEGNRNLDLFPEFAAKEPAPAQEPVREPKTRALRPLRRLRAEAALLDLAVCLMVLTLLVAGTALIGVKPTAGSWPALLLALAVFSFLYYTVPLAFWGRTPGMARVGLVARGASDGPLTFGQTFLRWLGAVLTIVTGGLPALLSLTGRSLADRLSGSRVDRTKRP